MDRPQLIKWLQEKGDEDFGVILEEVRAEQARRNPPPGRVSEKTKAIIQDLEEGMKPTAVAKKHGVSRQYVYKVRDRHGVTPA